MSLPLQNNTYEDFYPNGEPKKVEEKEVLLTNPFAYAILETYKAMGLI